MFLPPICQTIRCQRIRNGRTGKKSILGLAPISGRQQELSPSEDLLRAVTLQNATRDGKPESCGFAVHRE
jgi:hypothetical protein